MKLLAKFFAVIAVLAAVGCTSISRDDAEQVEQVVLDSFSQMFPAAENVTWSLDDDEWVASFYMSDGIVTKAGGNAKRHYNAWYNRKGHWKMTEASKELTELPEPVQAAFAASDYATWTVENSCSIERNDIVLLYLIEALEYADSVMVDSVMINKVKVAVSDTVTYVATKVELYYSETGYLVKENLSSYGPKPGKGVHKCHLSFDYLDPAAVDSINVFVNANYPGAEIADNYCKSGGAFVELTYEGVKYELQFNWRGMWVKTTSVVDVAVLPEAVAAAPEKYFRDADSLKVESALFVDKVRGDDYYKLNVCCYYTQWIPGKKHNSEPQTKVVKKSSALKVSPEGRLYL